MNYHNELRTFNVKRKDATILDDVVRKINLYTEQHCTLFYTKEDTDMVKLDVDDCYVYDVSDKNHTYKTLWWEYECSSTYLQ